MTKILAYLHCQLILMPEIMTKKFDQSRAGDTKNKRRVVRDNEKSNQKFLMTTKELRKKLNFFL